MSRAPGRHHRTDRQACRLHVVVRRRSSSATGTQVRAGRSARYSRTETGGCSSFPVPIAIPQSLLTGKELAGAETALSRPARAIVRLRERQERQRTRLYSPRAFALRRPREQPAREFRARSHTFTEFVQVSANLNPCAILESFFANLGRVFCGRAHALGAKTLVPVRLHTWWIISLCDMNLPRIKRQLDRQLPPSTSEPRSSCRFCSDCLDL